jgi:hypothetical protein
VEFNVLVKKQTGKSVIRKSRTREKVTREKVTAVRKTMPREKEREKVSALRKSIALLTKEAVKTTTTIGKFIAEKLHMQGALHPRETVHPQETVHTHRKFIARERSKEAEVGVCHLDALFNEMLLMKQINLTIIS